MMFASVDPIHLPDVHHSECRLHGDECYMCPSESEWTEPYEQHNPVNPILVEFRDTLPHYYDKALCLSHYIEYVTHGPVYGWQEIHVQHARRVLERLARLEGGAS